MYSLLEVDREPDGRAPKVLVKKLTKSLLNPPHETWTNIFSPFQLGEKENFGLLVKVIFEKSDYYSILEFYVCGFQKIYVLDIMFEE
jgi:hypothetical protein